jgi:hypothetical protein
MRRLYDGRPYLDKYPIHPEPPDWEKAPHAFVGASNRSSMDHTRRGAYRRKDERPGSTGAYAPRGTHNPFYYLQYRG